MQKGILFDILMLTIFFLIKFIGLLAAILRQMIKKNMKWKRKTTSMKLF